MGPHDGRRRSVHDAIVTVDRAFGRLLPVVAFLVAGAAVLLRQSGVPKVLTIWAEDGSIFAACAYARPLVPDCLFETYAGWIHVVPRMGAAVASLWPPADLSVALGIISAAVAGLTAAVVAIAVRDASGSSVAGLLAGASLVLVSQAGIEVGGNLTNLHWILIAGAIVLIIAWWVGARQGPGSLVLLAGAGLSSPFSPILPALVLVGAVFRRPGWRPMLVASGASALVQVAFIASTPRVPPGQDPFNLGLVIIRFVRDVVGRGAFGTTRLPLNWLVVVGIVATVALAAVLSIAARRTPGDARSRARAAAWRSIVAVAALVGTAIVLFVAMAFLQHKYNARYGHVPSVLVCVALVLGSALLRDAGPIGARGVGRLLGWAARLALPAAALLLVLGFARTFRLETKASIGPDYAVEFRTAASACEDAGVRSIRLRISPAGAADWRVEIPCDRVAAPASP